MIKKALFAACMILMGDTLFAQERASFYTPDEVMNHSTDYFLSLLGSPSQLDAQERHRLAPLAALLEKAMENPAQKGEVVEQAMTIALNARNSQTPLAHPVLAW